MKNKVQKNTKWELYKSFVESKLLGPEVLFKLAEILWSGKSKALKVNMKTNRERNNGHKLDK